MPALYAHPVSQPSRAVMWLLAIGGVEHEFNFIDLMTQAQKAPEYLAVNPLGLIPAYVDGDLTLTESEAILRYIARTNASLADWYPTADPVVAARVDEVMGWWHHGVRKTTFELFAPWLFALNGAPGMSIPAAGAEQESLGKHCERMETFLGRGTFIAGTSTPTIADLLIYGEVAQFVPLYPGFFEAYPLTNAWLAAMRGVEGHDAAHEPMMGCCQMMIDGKAAAEAAAAAAPAPASE